MKRACLYTALLMLMPSLVLAMSPADECIDISDSATRLSCYDRVLQKDKPEKGGSAGTEVSEKIPLSIWDTRLMRDANRDTFTLTIFKPNYIMYTYMSDPNQAPYEFTGQADRLDNEEIKFQLSGQTKVADNLFGDNGDIWFSYTQVAFWQLFNSEISAPFRETNYRPDFYLSFLTDYSFLGLTTRSINLGIVHESNGRAEPLSRSWNRVYANFYFTRDNLALSFMPWLRIEEDPEDDNNPDIEDFYGHYEFRAYYKWEQHLFSLMLRNIEDSDHRYNSELQWSYPLSNQLRLLVQWYNGYGENMIDYNHNNHRIGIGIMMTDWL